MFRGFYTAAAGMIAQNRRQQMITNNIANANTPGYKADQAALKSFPEMLLSRLGGDQSGTRKVGPLSTGVYMQEVIPNFIQGPIKQTNNKTDIAFVQSNLPANPRTGRKGALFFPVETPSGVKYTRNGHFTIDGQGYLATDGGGGYVLDSEGNRIQLPTGKFQILDDGQILINDQPFAQIGVSYAADPNRLIKEGSTFFRTENGQALPAANNNPNINFKLKQGALERSNVSIEQEMTDLMSTYRTFEANQKVLQAYDRSMDKAVNEVGRLG
ncbi:flagellar basal-body rod protein FlgG [Scopulibacillus daqui]|uniref:Flagellar basal-body rod protein FlgG n=1 Tax=Scopulibacillus daqui TaxID=1469162 RepID=A0ABS2Q0R0_9BACL|nr:flagellar hook-basal body protein [Scopulibacillus daqui]MBM7645884.1 flagellar basal-body rod protein FlgG [Scopulibacillus daqui]